MEEEEYNGCDGVDPQRRLDKALLSLVADRILLVTTAGAAATAVESTAIAKMSMHMINAVVIHLAGGLGGKQWQQRCNGR